MSERPRKYRIKERDDFFNIQVKIKVESGWLLWKKVVEKWVDCDYNGEPRGPYSESIIYMTKYTLEHAKRDLERIKNPPPEPETIYHY